jgi:DNA mismatch repair protein MutL
MLTLDLPGTGLRVTGLISSPDHNVATPKYQYLLVNRRVVSDRLLAGAMKQGYQGLLPRGRHPVFIMHLETASEQVDINVHPAKAEVRFKDSGRVFAQVLTAVRQALESTQRPGRQEFSSQWISPPAMQVQESKPAELFGGLPPLPPGIMPVPIPPPAAAFAPPTPEVLPADSVWRFAELPILGQLQGTYILAQAPEGLLIIDQHAAHERVLFELLSNSADQTGPRQTLLFPRAVELDPAGAAWVEDHLAALHEAGLEVEPFGGSTFLVRAVPACLAEQDLGALVPEMVADLALMPKGQEDNQLRRRLHLIMACRGAIKAGQRLSLEEMHYLMVQLDALAVSSHCPHGRPLWRLLTMPEIRQNFRRPKH